MSALVAHRERPQTDPGLAAAAWRFGAGALLGAGSHGLVLVFTLGRVPPVLGPAYPDGAPPWLFPVDALVGVAEVVIAAVLAGALAARPDAATGQDPGAGSAAAVRAGRALGWIFIVQSVAYLVGIGIARDEVGSGALPLAAAQALLIWLAVGILQALRRGQPFRPGRALRRGQPLRPGTAGVRGLQA
jgi:hypothetical protein